LTSDTKFRINLKEGLFELEGNEEFVDKHLEKFEEIFKVAIKEVIINNKENLPKLDMNDGFTSHHDSNNNISLESFPSVGDKIHILKNKNIATASTLDIHTEVPVSSKTAKHSIPKLSVNIPPLPVDLKANVDKPGLREFCKDKNPSNHYEKTTLFVYYLTKYNKQNEVKFGEILSCYEEINEKKPSVIDIVKNSIRYKGWLEPGSEKYSTRLTISGENYIKFDLPKNK
jgi:hypothetical protein